MHNSILDCMKKLRNLETIDQYKTLKTSIPYSKILKIDKLYESLVYNKDFKTSHNIIEEFSKSFIKI